MELCFGAECLGAIFAYAFDAHEACELVIGGLVVWHMVVGIVLVDASIIRRMAIIIVASIGVWYTGILPLSAFSPST